MRINGCGQQRRHGQKICVIIACPGHTFSKLGNYGRITLENVFSSGFFWKWCLSFVHGSLYINVATVTFHFQVVTCDWACTVCPWLLLQTMQASSKVPVADGHEKFTVRLTYDVLNADDDIQSAFQSSHHLHLNVVGPVNEFTLKKLDLRRTCMYQVLVQWREQIVKQHPLVKSNSLLVLHLDIHKL